MRLRRCDSRPKPLAHPEETIALCEKCHGQPTCAVAYLLAAAPDQASYPVVLTRYPSGQRVLEQGAPSTGLHVVCEGLMLVTVLSPRGVESVLHLVAAGGSLDATDNLTQSPTCSVSAETLTDSTIAFIRSETLRRLLDADPRFPAKLLPQIAAQMRRLEARYARRDAEKVSARLIQVLLDLVCLGDQTRKHAVILPHGLTRLALARIVGTTPETLCRVLGRLQRASVIRLKDRSIEIPDVHRLREALTRKQPRNS